MPATAPADTLIRDANALDFGPGRLSSPFDGIAFTFTNDSTVAIDDTATGWLVGSPGVILNPSPDHLNLARDLAWPADYELRWFGSVVDTSLTLSPAARFPAVPVNFHVTNVSSGSQVKFIIDDADRSSTLSFGDTVRIIDGYVSPSNFFLTYQLTWQRGPGLNPLPPQAGDRYVLRTRRPFAQGDFFEFQTVSARSDAAMAKNELNRIAVVPNPYIGSSSWERRTLFTTGRGDRRIDFIHLPAVCTVRIYTVAGYLVKTLTRNAGLADGALSWDLVTDDGMDIAFGLYIYHVDAPDIGEHIGKFAVIK